MIQEVLVAVYGSLRKGMGNHGLLERNDAQLLSTERVTGWNMYSLGGFPYIEPGDGVITIEVYAVPITAMQPLDRLEGYPSFYNRKLITTSKGDAWVYYIEDYDSSTPVPNGDWVAYRGMR
jgi:gamma-glutamylcyclotransferase (GGCT)/AIG2-like uncharacterized protein YtfP